MSVVPPDWYPDVNMPGTLRWWDGRSWTAHEKLAIAAADAEPLVVGADSQYTTTPVSSDEELFFEQQAQALFGDPSNFIDETVSHAVPGTAGLRSTGEDEDNEGGGRGIKAILIGVLLIAVTFAIVTPATALLTDEGNSSARGTVVELRYHQGAAKEKDCSPIAKYTVDKNEFTASSGFTAPCAYRKGEAVEVRYDSENPANTGRIKVGDTAIFALVPTVFGAAGLLTLLAGIATAIGGSTFVRDRTALIVGNLRRRVTGEVD